MPRRRLDVELVRRGLADSRAEAQAAVEAGLVTVAGSPATKAARSSQPTPPCRCSVPPARSCRAAERSSRPRSTASASTRRGRDCLDAGASTGGFTDCLLQRGRGARGGRRRRVRPARLVAAQRPPRDRDGADERADLGARRLCRSRRTSSSPTSRSSRCGRCCRRSCALARRARDVRRAGQAAVRGGTGTTWGAAGWCETPRSGDAPGEVAEAFGSVVWASSASSRPRCGPGGQRGVPAPRSARGG